MVDVDPPTIGKRRISETLEQIRRDNDQLRQDNYDLRVALSMTAEHGDLIETQLYETNIKLKEEVIERRKAQSTLQSLLDILSRQRDDLEVIVQTIMEHGDVLDIQWREKLTETLRQAAMDSLTRIPNRRRFDEQLELQWQQMERDRAPLSILLCDVDFFKQYNDAHGHIAGDNALTQVAQTLCSLLHRPNDLLARYGGEEFAAVLPNTDLDEAVHLAERMQAAISTTQLPHPNSPISPHITLSIGVACTLPHFSRPPVLLVDAADQMLYLAKQNGRNRIIQTFVEPTSSMVTPLDRPLSQMGILNPKQWCPSI